MTARSSLTLCSRLEPISEPRKDNPRRGYILYDSSEIHAIDTLVVWLSLSKSLANLLICEGERATV